jgi:hypothetical protein
LDTAVYTVSNACGAVSAHYAFTIVPLPLAGVITGGTSVCIGSALALFDTVAGGIWSSNDTALAQIDTAGVVAAIRAGWVRIAYSYSNMCGSQTTYRSVLVNPFAGVITGPTSLLPGATGTFTDTLTGGTWLSGSPTIATINPATGNVAALTAGLTLISYSVSTACGTGITTALLNVGYCLPYHYR